MENETQNIYVDFGFDGCEPTPKKNKKGCKLVKFNDLTAEQKLIFLNAYEKAKQDFEALALQNNI
jgi:hypothetical protein